MRKIIFLVFLVLFSCKNIKESEGFEYKRLYEKNNLALEINLSKTNFKIAEPLVLKMYISFPKNEEYYISNIKEINTNFLILDNTVSDPVLDNEDLIRMEFIFFLEAKRKGTLILPGFDLVRKFDNKTYLITETIKLSIESVLEDPEAKEIKADLSPLSETSNLWIIIILVLILILLGSFVFFKYYKKKQKKEKVENIFLKKLDLLYDKDFSDKKNIYYELDFILRAYLEKKYFRPFSSFTYEENLNEINNNSNIIGKDKLLENFELFSKLKYTDLNLGDLKIKELINSISNYIKKGKELND